MRTNLIFAALLLVPSLAADEPRTLEREFEGRRVTALLDLPGDSSGADVHVGRRSALDFTELGGRNRRFGVSIRSGNEATITKIKVKEKLIEVHLDGGGYGFSDAVATPQSPTTVEKSKREKRLQDEAKAETDPSKKEELGEELDDLKQDRRREEARLRAEAAQVQAAMQAVEAERRLRSGSRINLRFDGGVTSADATPEALMAALDGYLDFGGQRATPAPGGELRKGMSRDEVSAIHGQPGGCERASVEGMSVETCLHENERGRLEARYVDGVLVKFVLESR